MNLCYVQDGKGGACISQGRNFGGGGFVRAVAPEHVSAALNLVIAALIFAPRFDIDVPAPPKFLP